MESSSMNITQEQSNVTDIINSIPTCEDSCMRQKRKDNGLPEIEDCPELIDYELIQLRKHQTVITKGQLKFLNERADENYKFITSFWYKLYKFFN